MLQQAFHQEHHANQPISVFPDLWSWTSFGHTSFPGVSEKHCSAGVNFQPPCFCSFCWILVAWHSNIGSSVFRRCMVLHRKNLYQTLQTMWTAGHSVSDCCLHHEQQWLAAAMTSHWVHQLLTVDIDKYIIICPQIRQILTQTSTSSVSAVFLEPMERFTHNVG